MLLDEMLTVDNLPPSSYTASSPNNHTVVMHAFYYLDLCSGKYFVDTVLNTFSLIDFLIGSCLDSGYCMLLGVLIHPEFGFSAGNIVCVLYLFETLCSQARV